MPTVILLLMALVATPICAYAAVEASTQDSTYLRLDGANSGLLTAVGQVRYARGYPGADFGAKVSAAIAALGSTGGTVDATSLSGSQSMSATIKIPNGVTVLLGSGLNLTSSVCPVFQLQYGSHLKGAGAWVNAGITTYITTNSSNCNAITTGVFSTVEKLTIDNTALTNTNSNGIYSFGGGDNNVRWVRINNFSKAVYVKQDYYDVFEGIQAIGCNYGAYFDSPLTAANTWIGGNVQCNNAEMVAGFYLGATGITLINPTVENAGGVFGIGYHIVGTGNTLISPYFENVLTGIQLEPGAVQNFISGGTSGGGGASFVAAEGADVTQNSLRMTGAGGTGGNLFPDSNLATANFLDFDDATGNRLLRFQHDGAPITALSLVWGPEAPSPPYTPGYLAPLNVSRLFAPQMFSAAVKINLGVSGTVTMDLTQGEMQEFRINGNVTSFSFTNQWQSERATIEIFQLFPGGQSWQWSSNIKGGMDVDPGIGKTSVQSFQYDGTNWVALGPGFSY